MVTPGKAGKCYELTKSQQNTAESGSATKKQSKITENHSDCQKSGSAYRYIDDSWKYSCLNFGSILSEDYFEISCQNMRKHPEVKTH